MARLAGKVALVTGAAMGIGKACALALAQEGARVAVTDIDRDQGLQTVSDIEAEGGEALFLEQDVTDEAAWIDVLEQVISRWQALHVLVNNAGVAIAAPTIMEMSLADFRKQNAINLDGVFLGMKHGIPHIAASGGGSVINLSSVAGLKGAPGLAAYSMTKGGVRLLSRSVARECINAGNNVRVNSVHPGIIDTAIWDKMGLPSETGANTVDRDELAALMVPGGKLGSPKDIANGVVYLTTPEAAYMAGMELVIDHGFTA